MVICLYYHSPCLIESGTLLGDCEISTANINKNPCWRKSKTCWIIKLHNPNGWHLLYYCYWEPDGVGKHFRLQKVQVLYGSRGTDAQVQSCDPELLSTGSKVENFKVWWTNYPVPSGIYILFECLKDPQLQSLDLCPAPPNTIVTHGFPECGTVWGFVRKTVFGGTLYRFSDSGA